MALYQILFNYTNVTRNNEERMILNIKILNYSSYQKTFEYYQDHFIIWQTNVSFQNLKHFLFWVNRFWRKGLLPSALLWCSQSFIQELDCFLGQSAAYFSWFLNAFTSLIDQRRSCWHVMSSTYIKCMKQAFKFY